jgi:Family of unknown function (DUF6328)
VAETGIQILFAFPLTLPFTSRFAQLYGRDIGAYAVATVGSVVATITLVTPVSYHRLAFRKGRKPELVNVTSVLALVGLAAFGIAFISAGSVIADVVLGPGLGDRLLGTARLPRGLAVALPAAGPRRLSATSMKGLTANSAVRAPGSADLELPGPEFGGEPVAGQSGRRTQHRRYRPKPDVHF